MTNQDENTRYPLLKGEKFFLKLFISGSTPRSVGAVNNITEVCRKYLDGNFELQIIDVYENPQFAREDQILVIPTLLRVLPSPRKKIVGDLSDPEKVLSSIGV
jgi:circadian clock protein KaiB